MNLRNVESIQPHPSPKNAAAVGQRVDTTRVAMQDIMLQADSFGVRRLCREGAWLAATHIPSAGDNAVQPAFPPRNQRARR